MNGVAAEFAVEVLVHFQQRYGNSAAGKEQSKDGSGGPSADDATACHLNVTNLVVLRLLRSRSGQRGHDSPPGRLLWTARNNDEGAIVYTRLGTPGSCRAFVVGARIPTRTC